jgi:hypothetical protein
MAWIGFYGGVWKKIKKVNKRRDFARTIVLIIPGIRSYEVSNADK